MISKNGNQRARVLGALSMVGIAVLVLMAVIFLKSSRQASGVADANSGSSSVPISEDAAPLDAAEPRMPAKTGNPTEEPAVSANETVPVSDSSGANHPASQGAIPSTIAEQAPAPKQGEPAPNREPNQEADQRIASDMETVSDVLDDPTVDWQDPEGRARAVARMKQAEDRDLAKATERAKQLGQPLVEDKPGGKRELVGLDEHGELLYVETKNANAAISTGANLLHPAPYSLDGAGLIVGVWDADSALITHQEFNEAGTSRVRNVNSQPTDDHATHVTGTIAAYGVTASAKGMAPKTLVDSYDWTNDDSEMAAAGATGIGQFDTKVYLSNHSYGFSYGWRYSSTNSRWEFYGTGSDQNAYDSKFGRYSQISDDMDTIAFNAPYYNIFWAAGNENTDGPNNGNSVSINGAAAVTYNSSIHPQNDGTYRNGFETVADESASKNLIVIGAANDAVTSGQRDSSKATKVNFSSTGPTDDGRIKPDLMANGVSVYSTTNTGDTAYTSMSGTSMASPNACGSATLLMELYRELFGSSAAMRASTLKALLIHTATDTGNPGPDYTNGWGLINVKSAADLLKRQADYPDLDSVVEDQLTTAQTTDTYTFAWDGVSPIRATLCWTDPPGTSDGSTHDERTPDLVNNLNLKLIAPNGTEYFPFVMPFVGTWTVASMSQNATTGVNNVDNVEQVHVATPGITGAWQAVVTYAGNLTNGSQNYGLIISGAGTAGNLVFNPNSYSVSENGGVATISVERVGGTTGACSVNYSTSNGTAIAGSDYTATSGTLSWNNGEGGAKTFNIPILNDGVSEAYSETVSLTLSNASGIAIAGTNPATLTIIDDETFMGVTSFNSGGTFAAGSQQNITWASSLGGNVRIELLKNGIQYTMIASSTPNDGLFSWTIPALAPTGSDYSIRITSLAGGGESDVSDGTFSINNQASGTIYSANMSTDPGWTLQGLWAYGTPTGAAGIGSGASSQRDPTAGFTGSNVIGYNLNGPYENNLAEMYATTQAIDCSGHTNVQLVFRRWLNVEASQYDNASIRVSNNGTTWTQVWAHSGSNLTANSWSQVSYDISAVADGKSTVYIRWVMGGTDSSVQYTGWNIDDVVVSGLRNAVNPAGEVAFSTANFQVSENAGTATITVNRTLGTSGAISVDYSTSNGTAVSGSDYTATSGTLSWANGDSSSKTFTVPISNDSTREDLLETLNLTLTNTVGGTIVGTNPATLTIRDEDNNAPDVDAGGDQFAALQPVTVVPGLYYGTVPGNIDTTTPNPNTTILINVASETENAIAGNTTEIYTGSIYDADGQISFTEHIDDKARIWIDGVLVLSNDAWGTRSSTANLNLSPGWHDIEIRISNGSGGSGPVASPGIGYDPAGGAAWQTLVDPGDGSLLRTEQAIPSAQVNLDGAASDLDSDPLTTTWSMVSGPASVAFGNTASVDTTATFSQEGIYTLRLTADDQRDPASDDVVITVASSGLALNIESASMAENGGTSNATVSRPGTIGSLVVSLSSSDTSEATVPASVTIPDGQTSAGFTVTAQDDAIADGTQSVTITASAAGNPDATDTIDVTDNEVATLTLNIAAASVNESAGAGATTATVTRNSPTTGEMIVNLSSNDTSEATVPSTVTIAAGQATSPAFNINAVDDSVVDGTQMVTVTASYAGHSNGTDTLDVTDDVPYTLTVVTGAGGASTTGGGSKDPDASPHAISATASTGYQFTNWTVTSGSGTVDNPNSANTSVSATSDTTVQANFEIITYTVGYNGNANTAGTVPGSQTKTYGVDLTLLGPGDLVKTGHTFSGWNTQANGGGTSYPAGGTYTANANATLYAQWTPDTYTVTYNANGSTTGTAPADDAKIHDVDLTLASNSGNLTKTGFSFAGWNTAADGSGTNYAAGGIYTDNAPLTLYAKWTPGADGTWAQTTAGPFDWGTSANWAGNIVASGSDRTAFFTPNITPDQVVNLEAPRTIGNITFTDSTTDSNNLTISGSGILTLSRSSGTPLIDVTQSNRTLTISSPVSGSNGLQKNGPGTLTLSGTNDYTGGTTLNGGTLIVNSNAALGSATTAITVNANCTLTSSAPASTSVDYTRAISLANSTTLTLRNATGNTTADFSGAITGSAGITISSAATSTIALSNTGNSFTGDLILLPTVNSNQFVSFASIGDAGAISLGKGSWRRVVQYTGASNLVLNTRRIDLNSSFGGVLDGGGSPVQIFENNGGGTVTFNSNLTVADGRTGTFFFGGTNTADNTFAGIIPNSTGGTLSIGKWGNGKWILSNNNSFSGSLTLYGGTLVLSGTNGFVGSTALNTATLSVNSVSDYGVASAIGAATGGAIILGNTSNATGTFEYTGSGHSSDRQFQIGATSQSSGNGVILNNGTGALVFDAPVFNISVPNTGGSSGSRNLTLGGTYTGDVNEIVGNIVAYAEPTLRDIAIFKTGPGTWKLSGNSTYTKTTEVQAGTLIAGNNAPSGNSGAFGTATSEIPLGLAGGNQDAALLIGGAFNVGRPIRIPTSNTSDTGTRVLGLGGNTAHVSEFSGHIFLGTTNQAGRGVTLTAASGGRVIFSGVIQNPSGMDATSYTVTKAGAGTVVLANANTYTGATAVNEGVLLVNNTTGSGTGTGTVSVAANATLGGTGIIGGNTTIAANGKLEFDISTPAAGHDKLELAATRTLTFSGASTLTITSSGGAQPGSYVLVTAPGGITGNAPATLNLPAGWTATVSKAGNDLVLNVSSTGGPGPVDHFQITGIPSQVTIGTEITGITITAQDAANQTATSFTGTVTFGGTAGITGTTANFVNGVLTGVSMTPMVAGSALTVTVDDGSGHTGSATFTVQSLFEDWAGSSGLTGGEAGPGVDPDGDGLTNLQEFAFGTNPASGRPGPIQIDQDGKVVAPGLPDIVNFAAAGQPPSFRAVYPRRKDHAMAGLIYTVEFSADLTRWTASNTGLEVLSTESAGDVDAVSVPFPLSVPVTTGDPQAPKFFRTSVSAN